jgi:hypothetical protein
MERKVIDRIVEVHETLGNTSTAIVQSVKCCRILLVHKATFCNRRLTKDQAMNEIAHLSRLDHSHILRVIGIYTI